MAVVAAERANDGYMLGKGEGEAHWLLGMLEIIKISGAETGGAYGLLEVTVRAGEGSPWHVHSEEDEWFYVLDGEFTVYVGEERLSVTPGSFAFGPKGVPHTFIGETDGAKALIGFQPFQFEGFLREVGEPATERVLPLPLLPGDRLGELGLLHLRRAFDAELLRAVVELVARVPLDVDAAVALALGVRPAGL